METWMKIGYALALGAMVLMLFPRLKSIMKNTPKATGNDWISVLLPIVGVILFVLFLISMVR